MDDGEDILRPLRLPLRPLRPRTLHTPLEEGVGEVDMVSLLFFRRDKMSIEYFTFSFNLFSLTYLFFTYLAS